MAKISDSFQHDAFRFLIEGVRNELLERWYGDPNGVEPENSIQGIFEETQARIGELPQLLDPDYADTPLDFLRWQVGWDDTPALNFVEDLDDTGLRKLIKLAVPLWKEKGTTGAVIDALRVFTGKSALVYTWFFHRWVVDEAGFWYEASGSDPWLVGGRYTEDGETLTHVVINREGLTAVERRFVYGLLSYVRPVGEHYAVIYAAFADGFDRYYDLWSNIGSASALITVLGDYRAILKDGAEIQTNILASEMATWSPTQLITAFVEFSSTSSTDELQIFGMRNATGTEYYGATVKANGTVRLTRNGATVLTSVETLPEPGNPFGVELKIEPQDQVTQRVTVLVGGVEVHTQDFVGSQAYVDSSGGVRLKYDSSPNNRAYVDNVLVLATPARVQYIGQAPITPTIGVGGRPEYIASPDPGDEEFDG